MDRPGDRGRPHLKAEEVAAADVPSDGGAAARIDRRTIARDACLALAIAICSWPLASLTPSASLDESWRAALHLAVHQRVPFGSGAVFSYGPLGFLAEPRLFYGSTAAAAWLFTLAVATLVAATLLLTLRRTFGLLWSIALAYVATGLAMLAVPELAAPVLFAWTLICLERPPPTRLARWIPVAAGAYSACVLLLKLNAGVACVGVALLMTWPHVRSRLLWLAAVLGSFCGSALAAWLLVGQPLGDLTTWLRGSLEIVAGYTAAMNYDDPGVAWAYAPAFALIALVGWLLGRATTALERRRRAAVFAAYALVAFASFKEAFVRADAPHVATFFGAFTFLALAVATPPTRRTAVWSAALAAVCLAAVTTISPAVQLDPTEHIAWFSDQLRILASSSQRRAAIGRGAAGIQAALAIDPAIVADARRGTVHVDPYETAAVWAYGLHWGPLPTFQAYSAYTPWLDNGNARAALGRHAPDRILRQSGLTIDGRDPVLEQPAAFLAMVCGYRQARVVGTWQELARVPDRCGPAVPAGSVTAPAGAVVAVPSSRAPDELVFARIHPPSPGLLDALVSVLYKPGSNPAIVLDGIGYRFVQATAADPQVLRMPPSAGFDAAFGGSANVGTVALVGVPSPVRYDFFRMRVAPAPG